MLYEPNTTQWGRGDIVIHWCDAKEPKMLMQVTGFTRDGLVKTQYLDKRLKRTVYTNPMTSLLDPTLFNLIGRDWSQAYLESYQADFESVRLWNHVHSEPGVWVKKLSADGQDVPVTRTTSKAFMQGHEARIWLEHGGMWSLRFVVAVPAPESSAPAEISTP